MPSLNKQLEARDKALPTNLKHEYKFHWFRRITLKERLLLLLGCNVHLKAHFLTEHSAGKVQPIFGARMTTAANAKQQTERDQAEIAKGNLQ